MTSFTIDASILKTFLNFLIEGVETKITVNAEGISTKFKSLGNTEAFKAEIPSNLLKNIGEGQFGIDIPKFEQAIHSAVGEVTVKSDAGIIVVTWKGRRYELGEIQAMVQLVETWPTLSNTASAGIDTKTFQDAVKEAAKIQRDISFEIKNGIFTISAGDESGLIRRFDAEIEVDYTDGEGYGKYNAELLPKKFPDGNVIVKLGEKEFPLELEIQSENGNYGFILAALADEPD